jgi:DNA-binding FadR family transcriptional regulator
MVQTAAEVPGQAIRVVNPDKKEGKGVDPVLVQQTLFRFADEISAPMTIGVEKLRRGTTALDAAEVLRWKIGLGNAITAIATGPNALANVLDMTVFVTVIRSALENHWQPKMFGASADDILEASRAAETNIWRLAAMVLQPEQQAELREAVEAFCAQDPTPETILAARAVGFASRVAPARQAAWAKSVSVFGLLNLDPLSSLDPATRELAQTRLFGERALYLAHRMPTLLRWQTELLVLNTTSSPAVQQLVTNSTQLTDSMDRFASMAEQLPGQVRAEREQILAALQEQESELVALANEVRLALQAGAQMSTALNTTLTTFDALMDRFGVGGTNAAAPAETNAEPFCITDYQKTAAQLEATANQLTELLVTLDQTIGSTNLANLPAQVAPVVQQAQVGGKEIVDYAFRKGVLLVGIVLVAALLYRFLSARLMAANRSQNNA